MTANSPDMSVGLASGGGPAMQSPLHMQFRDQVESFRNSDATRERLMHQLLEENARLMQEAQEARSDFNNEKMSRRQWQSQAEGLRTELGQLHSQMDSDPFALALIDGDGCIFQKALLQAGAEGGGQAAHLLNEEIKKLLQQRQGSGEPNSAAVRGSVIVHIYASFDDLAKKLVSVGMLNHVGDFGAFARAFSLNQPLFNFVDVGRGKERADYKIKELFRLFVNNTHCKHIIFGGCHDNGYLLNLEPYRRDQKVANRITLLETTGAEWQYKNLGFSMVRFDSVFRDQPLPDGQASYFPGQTSAPKVPPGLSATPNNVFATPQTPARSLPPRTAPAPLQSPGGRTTLPSPAPTPTSAETNGRRPSPGPSPMAGLSYANIGGQTDAKTISIAPAKERARKFVLLNADNQRIDEKLPKVDQTSLGARVHASGKLCNNHHLRGLCKAGAACGYSHDPPLSDAQRLALRARARTSPCPRGLHCAEPGCYLGHVCPHDGDCDRGEACFFAGMHRIDQRPVLKIYDDESIELLTAV